MHPACRASQKESKICYTSRGLEGKSYDMLYCSYSSTTRTTPRPMLRAVAARPLIRHYHLDLALAMARLPAASQRLNASTPQRRNIATPQRRNASAPQRRNTATPSLPALRLDALAYAQAPLLRGILSCCASNVNRRLSWRRRPTRFLTNPCCRSRPVDGTHANQ